jgi:hypothetical protein
MLIKAQLKKKKKKISVQLNLDKFNNKILYIICFKLHKF